MKASAPTAALEQPSGGSPASPCRAASPKLRRNEECFLDQTANYQLSQWETTDRILMADFNADNTKIDTALKTLADKTGMVTLMEENLTGVNAQTKDFSLANIDWSRWKTLYLSVGAVAAGSLTYFFGYRINGSVSRFASCTSGISLRMMLFPLHDDSTVIHGLLFQNGNNGLVYTGVTFQNLSAFVFETASADGLLSICRLTILGEP